MSKPSDLLDDPDNIDPIDPVDPPVDPVDPPEDPPVDKAKPDRFKKDLLKQKDINASQAQRIKELERDIENQRVAKLKEQEKYQELYEDAERKRQEAEDQANSLRSAIVNDKKFTAVKTKALQMGLRKEALDDLDLLDLTDLDIETTSSGRVHILNVTEFVENLKITRPHWFGKKASVLNPSDPEVIPTDGMVTLEMVQKAEKEYKKTGDSTKYLNLLLRYKKQTA